MFSSDVQISESKENSKNLFLFMKEFEKLKDIIAEYDQEEINKYSIDEKINKSAELDSFRKTIQKNYSLNLDLQKLDELKNQINVVDALDTIR